MKIFEGQHHKPIKAWVDGVRLEESALQQLRNTASLDIVHPYVAVMPDVHYGRGATVGSVVPTVRAIVPACVGVDLNCGLVASKTTLTASDIGDTNTKIYDTIMRNIPVGGPGVTGSWAEPNRTWSDDGPPGIAVHAWEAKLLDRVREIVTKHPQLRTSAGRALDQLGTLGGGNHFIEVCLDENQDVWVMLHSGSRGIGNAIGNYFITKARERCMELGIDLPDRDLAWLEEGTPLFDDYIEAIMWASDYALENRRIMLHLAIVCLYKTLNRNPLEAQRAIFMPETAIQCHHNYVSIETHFGQEVYLTRKGAVSARQGELGIIPGHMTSHSYIVEGKGNPESFMSCSHGAGRLLARGEAKRTLSIDRHVERVKELGIACRTDIGILDETAENYKPVTDVLAAQEDLVTVKHVLSQIVNVKG